jgi:DNA-binding transcriptional ArsR family regulator
MNPMPKRKVLMLTDKAAELLPRLAGKYHNQGDYVSHLIEAAAEQQSAVAPALARLTELEQEIARLRAQLLNQNTEADR